MTDKPKPFIRAGFTRDSDGLYIANFGDRDQDDDVVRALAPSKFRGPIRIYGRGGPGMANKSWGHARDAHRWWEARGPLQLTCWQWLAWAILWRQARNDAWAMLARRIEVDGRWLEVAEKLAKEAAPRVAWLPKQLLETLCKAPTPPPTAFGREFLWGVDLAPTDMESYVLLVWSECFLDCERHARRVCSGYAHNRAGEMIPAPIDHHEHRIYIEVEELHIQEAMARLRRRGIPRETALWGKREVSMMPRAGREAHVARERNRRWKRPPCF